MIRRQVLVVTSVLLTGIAIIPWLRDPIAAADSIEIGVRSSQTQINFHDPGPLETYEEIIRRPVFVATRRPSAAPASNSGAPGEILLLDRYPVIGVVIAGEQRMLLIRMPADDTVSRIKQGAVLDGWTLTEVTRERLVLEMAGSRKEVSLRNNGGSSD